MLIEFKQQLISQLNESLKDSFPAQFKTLSLELETPAEKNFGEFSSNIALKSAKIFHKNPLKLAEEFSRVFQESVNSSRLKTKISKIEVKKPGFINFYLSQSAYFDILTQVFQKQHDYGKSDLGTGEKIQIEFVSANPTGPLSVAHGRQAAVGDALANILTFLGFNVTKEYYVNDEGNQINLLAESIRCRAFQSIGEDVPLPEDGYQGEYIIDIAQKFMDTTQKRDKKSLEETEQNEIAQFGVSYLLEMIKNDLEKFKVHFDHWAYQSKIATQKNIEEILAYLGEKGFLYEKDGALWFKSTDFGDDKDRVVEKSDESYTYLTPDIVYHKNKFDRGFKKVINIWGPDHHGYISRLKAAVEALGQDRDALEVIIVQLATIYKNGKPLSMSTRRGQYISLQQVMNEVGVDAARFFFLMRHINIHLDFDLELAKKETPENPVYYIQYAYARINSIHKKAQDFDLEPKYADFSLLTEQKEIELIKKLGNFSETLMFCYNQLDPFPLSNYLHELATCFHKFYDCHRVIDQDKSLSCERLGLTHATRIVLANGLQLLGLCAPERM